MASNQNYPYAYNYQVDAAGPQTDNQLLQSNQLYNYQLPYDALRNSLRDRGLNPYASNPYMRTVMNAAPGLSTAYLMRQANSSLGPEQGIDSGARFKQFLSNAIGEGDIYGTLKNTAGLAQWAGHSARQFEQGLGSGQPNMNPYAGALQGMFAANDGRGLAQTMSSLYGSFMPPQMAAAMNNAWNAKYDYAIRQMGNNPLDTSPQNDLYRWMLGV